MAADPPVALGTTQEFAILAGSTVTNTGPSVIGDDIGLYPGTSVTGFPPGFVNATIHQTDTVAQQAKADLVTAYNDAAGRGPGAAAGELGGRTLTPGVYTGTTLSLTGTLTLNAQGNPNAVFIFQSASTLITASNSTVALINGARACNVFWQVGSSATLGTNTTLAGTVLALTSISAQTGTAVDGRLLARNGAVTLDTNVITGGACATATPSASATPSVTATPTVTATPSVTATPTAVPTPGVTVSPGNPGTGTPGVTPPNATPGAPGVGDSPRPQFPNNPGQPTSPSRPGLPSTGR